MKKGVVKIVQAFLVFIVALIFVSVNLGETQAGTFQIPPKGKKKIKIAVVDWYSGIEVSALTNNYYKKWAKERGWDLQIFDVGADPAKAQTIVQNVITAGYDGIIVNWTDFKYYDQLVMKAYKAGIPLQGIACGNIVSGCYLARHFCRYEFCSTQFSLSCVQAACGRQNYSLVLSS